MEAANAVDGEGRAALWRASGAGDVAKVKAELARGAGVNKADTEFGATPLYIAAFNGHVDALKALLVAGADKTCKFQGFTALDAARSNGHAAIVKLLFA